MIKKVENKEINVNKDFVCDFESFIIQDEVETLLYTMTCDERDSDIGICVYTLFFSLSDGIDTVVMYPNMTFAQCFKEFVDNGWTIRPVNVKDIHTEVTYY